VATTIQSASAAASATRRKATGASSNARTRAKRPATACTSASLETCLGWVLFGVAAGLGLLAGRVTWG
jgi:hypothetical protein